MARSGRIVNSSPAHEIREVAEPRLCDIDVHEEPNKPGCGKKGAGVLFHRLQLLSTNKGGVAKARGLRPRTGPRELKPPTHQGVGRPKVPANSSLHSNAQASC